jgi:hypothetical protein
MKPLADEGPPLDEAYRQCFGVNSRFFAVCTFAGARPHMEDRHTVIPDWALEHAANVPRQFAAV